jgi:hypothetical protein
MSSTASVGTVMKGQFFGATLAAAFTNPGALDIFQVINASGTIVWTVSSTGVVTTNPSTPTTYSLLAPNYGSSFTNAVGFNPGNLDVLQVINEGGSVVFHIDSLGTAYTP